VMHGEGRSRCVVKFEVNKRGCEDITSEVKIKKSGLLKLTGKVNVDEHR